LGDPHRVRGPAAAARAAELEDDEHSIPRCLQDSLDRDLEVAQNLNALLDVLAYFVASLKTRRSAPSGHHADIHRPIVVGHRGYSTVIPSGEQSKRDVTGGLGGIFSGFARAGLVGGERNVASLHAGPVRASRGRTSGPTWSSVCLLVAELGALAGCREA